jgi:D-proline reductase (dithiol) PrdB
LEQFVEPIPLEPLDTTGLQEKFDDWIGFVERSHHGSNPRVNSGDAFTALTKPLAESRVALVTTAGAHLDTQEPFHVETVAGDPTHRILPDDLDPSSLRFTHTHYDTSSAEQDPNCVFPIDRLHELVERGRIGEASPVHIGMMGFNPDPGPIQDGLAPRVAGILADAEVDVAIMVPG